MTSASWFNWILHESLVFFADLLPPVHYEGYSKFVRAIQICCQNRITLADIDLLETLIVEFLDYIEEHVYQYDIKRIQVWRPVLHQFLHVPGIIRLLGPMKNYSQWTCER
ncbi:hypothetical protein BJ508DRAFT_219076, partial [Ascobolus immersus RN42]